MKLPENEKKHSILSTVVTLAFLLLLSTSASAKESISDQIWAGTWATAPVVLPPSQYEDYPDFLGPPPPRIHNQTLRQIVHSSIGGSSIRVALTNLFGSSPLEIGAAHIALHSDAATDVATIVPNSGSGLLFAGNASVTIAPGSTVLSDAADMEIPALGNLVIDLYFPGNIAADSNGATVHLYGLTTNYLSSSGDHTGESKFPVERSFQNCFFLSRIEVLAPSSTAVVVALGDSITEGAGSTADTNSRWPDQLARRLASRDDNAAPVAVLNMGIGGNRLLSHNLIPPTAEGSEPKAANPDALFGPSALSRADRDVFLLKSVTHIIVLESINDIGSALDAESPTVEELINGHRALIQRAHTQGLKIIGATLTPFEGAPYFTSAGEAKRQALNEWVRNSLEYDGVIDFDAAVRDPARLARFNEAYQSGDWLHPNDEGYRVMAEAIDLDLFKP